MQKITSGSSLCFLSTLIMIGLCLFLSACQSEQRPASNQAPLTKMISPTLRSSALPTKTVTPTDTPPVPRSEWKTYTDHGLKLTYPGNWKQGTSDRFAPDLTIDFQASGNPSLPSVSITLLPANPGGSEEELLYYLIQRNMRQYSNAHQIGANSTRTFAGLTWHTATFTADENGIAFQEVDMVGQNPASGKVYYLSLRERVSRYDQTNTAIFQPMLQSLQLS
ncbi:MAG TPA: hypothetical protein VFN35_06740 [Ktedonobacteraceae bacterium]|nr:hypothetical protein [Ktedonobacteraceae bacterium]